jgi:hypothetical protein
VRVVADLPEPPVSAPAPATDSAGEVEVGLAAFLPEGVEIADDAPAIDGPAGDGPAADGPAEGVPGSSSPSGDDGIDLDLLVELEADLDAVGLALAALDDGSYGTCAVCGSPLAADALAADPVRRTCDAHLPAIG